MICFSRRALEGIVLGLKSIHNPREILRENPILEFVRQNSFAGFLCQLSQNLRRVAGKKMGADKVILFDKQPNGSGKYRTNDLLCSDCPLVPPEWSQQAKDVTARHEQ
jgi:hypothetical protein